MIATLTSPSNPTAPTAPTAPTCIDIAPPRERTPDPRPTGQRAVSLRMMGATLRETATILGMPVRALTGSLGLWAGRDFRDDAAPVPVGFWTAAEATRPVSR